VGAAIRTASDSSLRKLKCWTAGGRVGDSVKKAPTVPFAQLMLN
jgi:hypothetical protein